MVDKDPQLNALEVGELDMFVDSIEPSRIDSIGNQVWIDWHIRLQKLNQQAVLEATSMQEELTKETLISSGKLPILVQEAICIQVWRYKIYPQILKLELAPSHTFGIYMVLYHEAACVGLLETVLYHEDGARCLSDVVVDLLAYAVEQLTALLALLNNGYLKPQSAKELECETATDELERRQRDLQFDISMRCITIVRYIAEHMESAGVGASIATAIYKTNDVPSILSHLLQQEPWRRTTEAGELQTFNFGRWSKPSSDESAQMHRSEAQLWLCLRQLLLEPRLANQYPIDECRRTAFCRLQARLTENILDQVPPLGDLKQFLCRLSVGDYSNLHNRPNVKNPGCTLIEVVPQILSDEAKLRPTIDTNPRIAIPAEAYIVLFSNNARKYNKIYTFNFGEHKVKSSSKNSKTKAIGPTATRSTPCAARPPAARAPPNEVNDRASIKDTYLRQVHKRTKSLAKQQLRHFNMDGSDESRQIAKQLLGSYTSDAALALDGGGAKCAKCGEAASNKCSRCKTEWYCGRECQVQQWPKHKELCDQFAKLCV